MTFNHQFPPPVKSHFLNPPLLKSKSSDVLFSAVPLLVYLSMFLQLVELTGFLHPVVKQVLTDQGFLSGEGEGKMRLEECSHTGRCRPRMNVQKGVEIVGEAAGSK